MDQDPHAYVVLLTQLTGILWQYTNYLSCYLHHITISHQNIYLNCADRKHVFSSSELFSKASFRSSTILDVYDRDTLQPIRFTS